MQPPRRREKRPYGSHGRWRMLFEPLRGLSRSSIAAGTGVGMLMTTSEETSTTSTVPRLLLMIPTTIAKSDSVQKKDIEELKLTCIS